MHRKGCSEWWAEIRREAKYFKMYFKLGPSRAVAPSLNINGGKMWWGRWVSCYLRHLQMLQHVQAATFPNKCTQIGVGVHHPASQMLCPTPSLTPVRVRKVHLPFLPPAGLGGPCCTVGCSPTAAPASAPARPWEWRKAHPNTASAGATMTASVRS